MLDNNNYLEKWKTSYPEKFADEAVIFSHIRRGDRIFVSSGCGEPQYLVSSLVKYVESHPKAFFDTEIIHIYSFGIAPYTDPKFKTNFRHNSFFVGDNTRTSVNDGSSDYTPISMSSVPALLHSGFVKIDVALIQTSPPDEHGFLSLGVSIDMVKAAIEKASVIIAQVNSNMPRTHGDGFIHIKDVQYILPHDEPLLELQGTVSSETAQKIGQYVSRLVQDGDTIQVGFGILPNEIMANLGNKKHLGVHTELLSDGLINLMKLGVIDNSQKMLNRGKTIATFCMGKKEAYEYIHDNPAISFRTIDYTNDPLVIAQEDNIVAINSALEIDLTGQATSESIGSVFYSGIGGHQDFMRGAIMARNGKTILTLQSTALDGSVSRIVPVLSEAAGVTLNRGDVRYVVTEFGIAYLHGKTIRERAMDLIAIAHPKFRPWLLEEAKKRGLIYRDQAFLPGGKGEYREYLEAYRTTAGGLHVLYRPFKISDEPLYKDFVYALSDVSIYRRFFSGRLDMPHERIQDMVIVDYSKEMAICAVIAQDKKEIIVGVGRYYIDESSHSAEIAFAVRDDYQRKGIGSGLLAYLTYLAKRQGLLGFTAEVLSGNEPMLHTFAKGGFDISRKLESGIYKLELAFRD
ncbi:MAG: Succinyl-CoA:coenzyme A transferase [Syntrophus sp. PtaB.Bin001]|nr:MAG: Succinyl-CoA:coenzyme A transferase [Syntrophus sp. PtaB.Bin001]